MTRSALLSTIAFIHLLAICEAASAFEYPQIKVLSQDDLLFVQHQSAVEDYHRLSRERVQSEMPPVSIFQYLLKKSEDLFSLNARLSLPYDTLATLNGVESIEAFSKLSRVLVCTQPGIFINDPPIGAVEEMMLSDRLSKGKVPQRLVLQRASGRASVYFFAGDSFTPVERAFFLRILLRFPVVRGIITSQFGIRKDPISGSQEFHNGIDIGAGEGSAVYAAREGIVSERGSSEILGNYLVLTHPGGYQTVYGHLSAINVILSQDIHAGQVIGTVGTSGRTTGPHLHFEVRRKGNPTDPFPLLAAKSGKS